jgi:hypothetical protein
MVCLVQSGLKKGETSEELSQEHAHHFLLHLLICHKEFVLEGQTVKFAYYCDFYGERVKICEDFAGNFSVASTHRLTLPFYQSNLTKNNMTSFPPYVFLFPRLKIKLKGRHFDATVVIEADSRMNLKNCRSAENGSCAWKGPTSRVIVASRPKVSF